MSKRSPIVVDRDNWQHEAELLRAINARLLEALEGTCSKIGTRWHRLGCETFQRPYGECDYACVQARAVIEEARK